MSKERIMKAIKATMQGLLLAGLVPYLLASCTDTGEEYLSDGGEVSVPLHIRVPGSSPADSRAVDESLVLADKLQVLVFNTDDHFLYEAEVTTSPDAGTSVYVTLRENRQPRYLVILANHTPFNVREGLYHSLGSVLENFHFTMDASGYTADALPMWGRTEAQVIQEGVSFGDEGVIALERSLAGVKVDCQADAANFILTSVHVFNSMDRGYVAPLHGNMNDGKLSSHVLSIPADAAVTVSPLVYQVTGTSTLSGIYLAETDNHREDGTVKDKDELCCLVIGGKYNGSNKETFYQVDFNERMGSEVMRDIHRNVLYTFTLSNAVGPGAETVDEALKTAYDVPSLIFRVVEKNLTQTMGTPPIGPSLDHPTKGGEFDQTTQDFGGSPSLGGMTETDKSDYMLPQPNNGPELKGPVHGGGGGLTLIQEDYGKTE